MDSGERRRKTSAYLRREDVHFALPGQPRQRKISILPVEPEDRGQWKGQFDFLMSMIAYAVGLGNVWRFPYLCFKNGGGSFLLVYFLFWALGAIPVFLMEVTAGQYLQRGGIEMWNVAPIFKGVGIGNIVIAFMCTSYYCVIITWALYYLLASIYSIFTGTFPWETCDNWWNEHPCLHSNSSNISSRFPNLTASTSVEQFWEKRVLMLSPGIWDLRGIQWELLLIKVMAWLIIYFALWKGITEARKFVYFCALSPYVLLFILLIKGATLPGASNGIYFYLMPNVTKLADTTVWKDAGTQVFYSYGVGFGALIALGSHNKYNHNFYRDAAILCCINAGTSLLAGFVVFSILGHMSLVAVKSVDDIVKPGVGLAFQVYPEVATLMRGKQIWAILFFLMLCILGIDSQVCMMEGLVTAIEDKVQLFRRYKKISLTILCFILFLIGIPMISHAGSHWLTLVDAYGASGVALLWVVFFEVIGLSWAFGAKRLSEAIYDMLGFKPNVIWQIIWKYLSPLATLTLFFFCVFKYEPLQYPDKTDYPVWSQMFGLFLSLLSMAVIPLYAIYYLCTAPGTSLKARLTRGLTPTMELRGTNSRESSLADGMKLQDHVPLKTTLE